MQFIDIHCHIYPDNIAEKAAQSVRDFYQINGANTTGTVAQLLERGAQAGISHYVVLPVAIRPDRVQGINDFILDETRKHDCFTGFGTVHAAMDGVGDEAHRIMDIGLQGIKIHPDSQRFHIDDPRLFPMYEAIQGRVPILLHMGDRRYNYSHPIKLRRILQLFPRLQAIAAHFGGYSMQETACELLRDTNCIMDVSSSIMFMREGEAEKYIRIYGAERLAYGTDYPLWDPVQEVERFLSLKITDEEKEQIAAKTAKRIFKL